MTPEIKKKLKAPLIVENYECKCNKAKKACVCTYVCIKKAWNLKLVELKNDIGIVANYYKPEKIIVSKKCLEDYSKIVEDSTLLFNGVPITLN